MKALHPHVAMKILATMGESGEPIAVPSNCS